MRSLIWRPVLKWSKGGFLAASLFTLIPIALFGWIFFIASKNPADSGESGILLIPFAMPWVQILPGAWIGALSGIGCILLNSLLVYLLFGGLRFRRTQT